MSSPNTAEAINLGWWNVLHDAEGGHKIGRNQSDRLPDITDIVEGYELPFGIVGFGEVHTPDGERTAAELADKLCLENHTFSPYGISGMAVAANEQFQGLEEIPLDPEHADRKAVVAWLSCSRAVVLTHPSHNLISGPKKRRRQMETLLDHIGDADEVILAGDLNALRKQQSRRMLEKYYGFVSVFETLGERHPPTYPADADTCDIGVPEIIQPIIRGFLRATRYKASIDGVYVRGPHSVTHAEVLPAVVTAQEDNLQPWRKVLSDHNGLAIGVKWAIDSEQITDDRTEAAAA